MTVAFDLLVLLVLLVLLDLFRLIGAGLQFFDVVGGDVEEGAAEEGEADEEGVGAVGVGANFALEAGEVAADDADGVVDAECGGDKIHGGVGVAEHEFELLHLCLADDGYGFVEAVL